MNASYLWGDYTRSLVNSYSDSYAKKHYQNIIQLMLEVIN